MKKFSITFFLAVILLVGFGVAAYSLDCGKKHHAEKSCCSMDMDPVCNMKIKDTDKAFKHEHEGHTFYFCSEQCRDAFKADPDKYMAKCCVKKMHCPVSGEELKDKDSAVKGEYKGKTVYFCCEKCKKAFDENPDKYMKKHAHMHKMKKKCGGCDKGKSEKKENGEE